MPSQPQQSIVVPHVSGFQGADGQSLMRALKQVQLFQAQSMTYGRQMPWNQPWGEIAYAQATANQAGIGAEADLTSLTTGAITYVANRIIEIRMSVVLNQQTAASNTKVFITDGSNNKLASAFAVMAVDVAAGSRSTFDRSYRTVSAAGAMTYKLRATAVTGTCSLLASATGDPGPAFIQVVDLGPAGLRPAS